MQNGLYVHMYIWFQETIIKTLKIYLKILLEGPDNFAI